jgi:hypothetical protein
VGPRIIRFGFEGDENEFKNYDEMMGRTGDSEWMIYGGHRLWHAPEAPVRTYELDNSPIEFEQHDGFVRTIQPVEPNTRIAKEMDIQLHDGAAKVSVTHRLRNEGLFTIPVAPWSVSVMAPGTKVIIPLPPKGTHLENLEPKNTMVMWAYTDMTDPRWTWGRKYVMLQQDPDREDPQKIGAMVPDGWAACARGDHVLVKTFAAPMGSDVVYPDMNCNVETFTNGDMIEIETMAPMSQLAPGATAEHTEHWSLHKDVAVPTNDAEVDARVRPLISQ